MEKKYTVIAFLAILHFAFTLSFFKPSCQHLEVNKQLTVLKNQQSSFEKQILSLIDDIKNIQLKVNASTNTDQKVIILQNAITSERQKISQLQNSIIPPFNLSRTACRQLTDDQKLRVTDQIQKAKDSVAKLKAIASKIQANPQVTSINADIAKQEIILNGIQNAIYMKCQTSVVLTPTIFQSNLFATNWILGRQSIDDIVQKYYQRSRLYHNVTNCPVELPFYDGTKCMKCSQNLTVFNMQSLKCEKCPYDTKLNTDKHICEQISHYTDYKNIENYALEGATLPNITGANTPCPSSRPFFNDTCVKCSLPSYWSVKDNICKDCPTSQVFNINTKTCAVPKGDTLTYLQGTSHWVTPMGNFTNIIKQRAGILAAKPNQYSYCGKDSPYFDGIQCITCPNQFSLADKKCVTAPTGLVYNPNLHAYVVAVTGKDTNPQAINVITASALPPTNNSCDIATPYFDGIACIQCPDPFPLFDTASKKCVTCSAFEQYDKTTLKCIKRSTIFISSNFNDLMATPKTNLTSYKAELLDKVKNNGDNIIKQCNSDEYSNYTSCFKCLKTEKFNMQIKKCDSCNGTIDPTTLICSPLTTLLTNLNASNLIVGDNTNMSAYAQMQNNVTGPTSKCPDQRPYAVGGLNCISCPDATAPYFSLQLQKCVNCSQKLYFNPINHKCQKEIFITNVAAVKNYIEVDNYTVANVKAKLQNLSKVKRTNLCSNVTPIASPGGDKCVACDANSFYNLKTKECIKGVYISNVAALKASGKVIQTNNNTLVTLQTQNNAIVQPKITCASETPLWNDQTCIGCPSDNFYSLQKKICLNATVVSNTDAISLSNNYIENGNSTLANLALSIKNMPEPKSVCPADTPLYSRGKCIACNQSLYNIEAIQCANCTSDYLFDAKTHACIKKPNYIPNLNNSQWIVSTDAGLTQVSTLLSERSALPDSAPCPNDSPHFSNITKNCQSCAVGTYWNYETYTCVSCTGGQEIDQNTRKCGTRTVGLFQTNLTSKNLLFDGLPKAQFQEEYNTNKQKYPQIQDCPSIKPFFDGFECITCPGSNPLFSLLTKLCSSCPTGSVYDETNKYCHSGKQIKTASPNVGKMYSSIF